MNYCIQLKALSFSLFGILFLQGLSAANPYIVCAKSMVALKEQGHDIPSLSRATSETAAKFLAAFMETNLPLSEFDHQPQAFRASANQSSSRRAKQAVARRMSALLNPNSESMVLYAGSAIDGAEAGENADSELIKYIQTLEISESDFLAEGFVRFENTREHLVPFFICDSQDYILDKEAFLKTWQLGGMSPNLMEDNFSNLLAPRILYKNGIKGYRPRPTIFLQFDRLFTSDPVTGKPVYLVFMRAYDKRPLYPKPVTKQVSETLKSGFSVPELVGTR